MNDDFFSAGYDPFSNPVVERPYTKGQFKKQEEYVDAEFTVEDAQPKAESGVGGNNTPPPNNNGQYDAVAEEVPSHEEEIPEPSFDDGSSEEEEPEFEELDEDDGKLGGDNLKDLSPSQKKKAAEKTADALLQVYCQAVPQIYKPFAKFNERKINKLHRQQVIDLTMKTGEGVSAIEHIEEHNKFVDEMFVVDEETQEAIREPLVEVLMEQGLALTATQRLLLAVGQHQVTLAAATYQLNRGNKHFIEDLQDMTETKYRLDFKKKKVIAKQEAERKKASYSDIIMGVPESQKQEVVSIMQQLGVEDDDDVDVVDAEETNES